MFVLVLPLFYSSLKSRVKSAFYNGSMTLVSRLACDGGYTTWALWGMDIYGVWGAKMVVRMMDEVPRFRGLGQKFGGSASVDGMWSVVGGVGLSSLVYGLKPSQAIDMGLPLALLAARKCARVLPLSAVQYLGTLFIQADQG